MSLGLAKVFGAGTVGGVALSETLMVGGGRCGRGKCGALMGGGWTGSGMNVMLLGGRMSEEARLVPSAHVFPTISWWWHVCLQCASW